VAIGTDSLASVEDLNLFSELKTMRWIAPEVPAHELLESATRVGAEALGLGAEVGTIEPGKRADLIAIDLDGAGGRVRRDASEAIEIEEYLLGGIDASQIQWVTG
jgi:cytosine/adenosine deaminase-related metal-dependent hydrolase